MLAVARVLGDLARRVRCPPVAGELAAGILLGPSVLGRLVPGSVGWLFPTGAPANMLAGYTLLSAVLLLTLAGLEIDISVVLRRRREALLTSVAGVLLPMAFGVALGLALPAKYLVDDSKRVLFALFMGTALSISAMPVIAKTLLDLGLLKTDLGLLVMASAMIDDVAGWLLFSTLVGPMHGQAAGWGSVALRVAGVAAFVVVVLTLGRRLIDRVLERFERERISAAGRVLSTLIVATVLGAAVTQAIGVHAVFGAFVVGVAVGDSPRLRSETRATVYEFVSNVFAPVFFAAVGLRVDFAASFDLPLVVAVFVVASVAKISGCSLGARAGGLPWREASSVGVAMNSRGAMEIILALIALETGLIRPPVFVALVVMALATSLIAGPVMNRLLGGRADASVRALAEAGAIVPTLRARTAEQAVRELAHALAAGTSLDGSVLAEAVLEREGAAVCGLSDGVALPHASVRRLPRPMLAVGRSQEGIDVDANDGMPAKLFFLSLSPEGQHGPALDVHVAVARAVGTAERRSALLAAKDRAEILDALAGPAPAVSPTKRGLA